MKLTPERQSLALVVIATARSWVPCTVARVMRRSLWAALSNPQPSHLLDSASAERARRAHANAVENLAVFAPVMLTVVLPGASTPGTVLAANVYLGARLVHCLVDAAGIPVVRTLASVVGGAATLWVAAAVLSQSV